MSQPAQRKARRKGALTRQELLEERADFLRRLDMKDREIAALRVAVDHERERADKRKLVVATTSD